MPQFADVILPLALPKNFTYRVPADLKDRLRPGMRVVVQVGKRKQYTALIYRIHQEEPEGLNVKEILDLEDEEPILNERQLDLWRWMAEYYMCSMGEVMTAALPSGLKLESETLILANRTAEYDENNLSDNEFLVMEALEHHQPLSISQVNEITGLKNSMQVVHQLLGQRLIVLQEEMKAGYRPRQRKMLRLNPDYQSQELLNQLFEDLSRAPKQKELILAYFHLNHPGEGKGKSTSLPAFPLKSLLAFVSGGTSSLKSLEEKGVFEIFEESIGLSPQPDRMTESLMDLNPHQNNALQQIEQVLAQNSVALLHGITSSGKTEIYTRFIRKAIDQKQQVLYLVPEIALTTQLISRLNKYFGPQLLVYHSRFSDRERVETWRRLHENPQTAFVVVGARSSVFLPFHNLGLVIVDEEHETSFKQHDPAPRYHARDTAIWLAAQFEAKTILGSATPSLESMYHGEMGKYGLVKLDKRYADLPLPLIECVDLKEARRKKQMQGPFSKTLIEEIREVLKNKKQVILFQNRRGFSTMIQCQNCGHVNQCKNCDISMTYHKKADLLRCHYCGYSRGIPKHCPACGSTDVRALGFGTEQLEEELKLILPEARVQRMDLDTTRRKNAYENIIADFEDGEVDILVGTQMVTKGLDFDRVALVGILNADNLLNFPDFRSHERAFQLMAQVAGRAGRKGSRGKVLIQTADPYHSIIRQVISNDYTSMFKDQLYERKNFNYPPHYRLIRITLKHKDARSLSETASQVGRDLRAEFGSRILGPEFPLIPRLRNLYQMELLLKLEPGIALKKVKQLLRQRLEESILEARGRTRVIYDVDPI